MKKVIYLFNVLTLILLPFSAALGEPLKTKEVEPNPVVSVAHVGFQTSFERAIQLSYLAPRFPEPALPSVKQDDDQTDKVQLEPLQPAKVPAQMKDTEPQGKVRTFVITAYTAGAESTGKSRNDSGYGKTYSGTTVTEGRTVSCPKSMPIGTELYIPKLDHTYVCEDRGGDIKEGRLDIYIASLKRALDFGRQTLEVIIVSKDLM